MRVVDGVEILLYCVIGPGHCHITHFACKSSSFFQQFIVRLCLSIEDLIKIPCPHKTHAADLQHLCEKLT